MKNHHSFGSKGTHIAHFYIAVRHTKRLNQTCIFDLISTCARNFICCTENRERSNNNNNNSNHCYVLICAHYTLYLCDVSAFFIIPFRSFLFTHSHYSANCRYGRFLSRSLDSVCFWNEFEGSRKINTKSIIFTKNWLSRRSNIHLSIRGLKIAHSDSYTFSHFDAQ